MRRALTMVVMAVALSTCALTPAPAQDHQHHHPFHQDFYRHWRDPANPNLSCCNARIEGPDGIETGDCEPTQAEMRGGNWWAWVRQKRDWIQVPDDKVLHERNPNGQDAHLCWTPMRGVICFVPPDTGI